VNPVTRRMITALLSAGIFLNVSPAMAAKSSSSKSMRSSISKGSAVRSSPPLQLQGRFITAAQSRIKHTDSQ